MNDIPIAIATFICIPVCVNQWCRLCIGHILIQIDKNTNPVTCDVSNQTQWIPIDCCSCKIEKRFLSHFFVFFLLIGYTWIHK